MLICAACGKQLNAETLKKQLHLSQERFDERAWFVCDRYCEWDRRKALGLYIAASKKGRDKRIIAVRKSNSENPRRKRKTK